MKNSLHWHACVRRWFLGYTFGLVSAGEGWGKGGAWGYPGCLHSNAVLQSAGGCSAGKGPDPCSGPSRFPASSRTMLALPSCSKLSLMLWSIMHKWIKNLWNNAIHTTFTAFCCSISVLKKCWLNPPNCFPRLLMGQTHSFKKILIEIPHSGTWDTLWSSHRSSPPYFLLLCQIKPFPK